MYPESSIALGFLHLARLRPSDRIVLSWLIRVWSSWQDALVIVQPATVIAWRRRKFRGYWTRLSRSGKPGRPTVPREVRDLICRMSSTNPLWGAPRYLLRDRDRIYGACFRRRVKNMGIEQAVIAARAPWQKRYVERLIGSIRRGCLDHMIVLNDMHLRRILINYFRYYHRWRTHQSLAWTIRECLF